ncbi:MAG: hypothetical protein AUJ92_20025 [Armatimonadetes bacterium CG2_30_59_28]|nr:MAG: hypothetical protein AUJ92_20025 [Armatimonadetes bacterium CG2_30_59_28]PIU60460.1 MAG: hypothetical protein COS85_24275 [Armatimonadetes bacterium CG07_land_8_20_14_0_80_59_28]PIY37156.1 MAG: hypothetical protein COZ05_22855 [Armatimonadetes bacterium CG_4_10_14_3_um_filter_59_10]PJB65973.1 MAG: hypothetical protein CO095_13580 [Armatimonadetes bacterium CG_4_9_14_3_um_filter_58_7]
MQNNTIAVLLHALGIFVCLLGIAFFSVCEVALESVNKIRLRGLAEPACADADEIATAHHLARESQPYLAAVVVGTNLPILLAAMLITHLVDHVFRRPDLLPWCIVGAVLTIVTLFELAPRIYTTHNAERVTLRLGRFVRFTLGMFRPMARCIISVGNGLLQILGARPGVLHDTVSEEQLKDLVVQGEEEGVLQRPETRLMENIFGFRETLAREVMVPRPDIVCLPTTASLEDALETIETTGLSRIPLFVDTSDNIAGVVYVKDLVVEFLSDACPRSLRELAHSVVFVPETKKADDLFREMRSQRTQLAIVVDEHGGTAGLVTIEDLVEEIVGEIVDEHDQEESKVRQVSGNEFIVDASIDIHDLESELGIDLPEGDFDTLGGFIYDQIDRVPSTGETVDTDDARFVVQQVRRNRILRVKLIRRDSQNEQGRTSRD